MTGLPRHALVADIGGTNARFALADLETLAVAEVASLPGAAFPSLQEAARAYLATATTRPTVGAFAVAGPVSEERMQLTNSSWVFSRAELEAALGMDRVVLVNDFEAQSQSLPHLGPADLHRLGGGEPRPHGTKAVLGPGTGLGAGGLVWSPSGWVAVPSEGGHSSFAVHSAEEFAIFERLRGRSGHVSVERVVSGPGLERVYRAVAELQGRTAAALDAAAIVERAQAADDPAATAALDWFVTWLGRFAGDTALYFGARGGVYIGGGIAPKLLPILDRGRLRAGFEAKGRLSTFLAAIPLYVILTDDAGLRGAAAALASRLAAR
jgi:glucokinase